MGDDNLKDKLRVLEDAIINFTSLHMDKNAEIEMWRGRYIAKAQSQEQICGEARRNHIFACFMYMPSEKFIEKSPEEHYQDCILSYETFHGKSKGEKDA